MTGGLPSITVATARGRFAVRRRPGTGHPILLIHGWPESSHCWLAVAEHLPADVDLIIPDLRGLGDSPREPETHHYTKDALAADMLAVLDALGIETAAVVGHDWGGIVAQEIAIAEPGRVSHLGIANIAVINNMAANRRIAAQPNRYLWYQHFMHTALPEAMIPGNERAFLETFLRRADGRLLDAAAVDEYVRCYARAGTATAAANYYRTYRDDIARWVAAPPAPYPMPAAYIHGFRDVVITPDFLDGIDDCFQDVVITRVDAGHFVQEEQPAAVAAAITALLAR